MHLTLSHVTLQHRLLFGFKNCYFSRRVWIHNVSHMPPWPNGQGVGLLIRRLRVRVPQGVLIKYGLHSELSTPCVSIQPSAFQTKRHRGDSNPCGQSPMDFESISLTARTQCRYKHGTCGLLLQPEHKFRTFNFMFEFRTFYF